jgi:ferric-chelate reductase
LYAACAVWGADRFVRIFRILLFGIRDGELKYVGDDTIRLSVKQGKFFDPFPGAYAFIYFGTPLKFWQSHPFTIMKSVIEEGHIVCYIKSKSGITKSIRDQLEKSPGMTKTMKIAVEGPYGHRSPIERYESVLLLGGGNGIPGLFSHASELVQRGLASKKRVKLIWSIRNAQSLCWFYDELKQLAGSSVQVDIFITGKSPKMILEEKPSYSSEKNSESEAKSESEKDLVVGESVSADSVVAELSSYVNFHYQRPDVDRLIKEELFAEGDPSVAVVTCGPPKMVDLARHSVATNLVEAKGRVDLFEELQVW